MLDNLFAHSWRIRSNARPHNAIPRLSPFLVSCSVAQPRCKSTSAHFRFNISPRLAPVEIASITAGYKNGFGAFCISVNNLLRSSSDKNLTRPFGSARRDTLNAGFSRIHPNSLTAKVNAELNTAKYLFNVLADFGCPLCVVIDSIVFSVL